MVYLTNIKDGSLTNYCNSKKPVMFNNEEEFNKIYREEYDYLLKVACFYLENYTVHSPKDVVNDVFFILLKKETIKLKYSIRFYLRGICKNLCFEINRKGRRMSSEEIQNYIDKLISNELEEKFNENELKKDIKEFLKTIPERRAEVFKLSRFEEKTNKEIAKFLGITESTVEQHITKVLKALRDWLKRLGYL